MKKYVYFIVAFVFLITKRTSNYRVIINKLSYCQFLMNDQLCVLTNNTSKLFDKLLIVVLTDDHKTLFLPFFTFSCKSLKFSTKWYTKLCILVDPFLRNCTTKSNFLEPKKALAFKGLKKNKIFSKLFQTGQIEFLTYFQSYLAKKMNLKNFCTFSLIAKQRMINNTVFALSLIHI